MKNSIVYLGIALLTFANITLASNVHHSFNINDVISFNKERLVQNIDSNEIVQVESNKMKSFENRTSSIDETTTSNPESAGFSRVEKSMEEIIAANNRITESTISNEIEPLLIGVVKAEIVEENNVNVVLEELNSLRITKSMDEIIAEDNKITERTITNVNYHLFIKKSIEEIIDEDLKITESILSNEIQQLEPLRYSQNIASKL